MIGGIDIAEVLKSQIEKMIKGELGDFGVGDDDLGGLEKILAAGDIDNRKSAFTDVVDDRFFLIGIDNDAVALPVRGDTLISIPAHFAIESPILFKSVTGDAIQNPVAPPFLNQENPEPFAWRGWAEWGGGTGHE